MIILILAAVVFIVVTLHGAAKDAAQKPGKPYTTRCPWCGEAVHVRSDGSFCCGWCGNFGKLPRMTDKDDEKTE